MIILEESQKTQIRIEFVLITSFASKRNRKIEIWTLIFADKLNVCLQNNCIELQLAINNSWQIQINNLRENIDIFESISNEKREHVNLYELYLFGKTFNLSGIWTILNDNLNQAGKVILFLFV